MKFVHCELSAPLISESDSCTEWIIERPELFSEYTQELLMQKDGKEGRFVLSQDNKIIDIPKNVEIILNPFAVDINDKRILNKIYQNLNNLAYSEECYMRTQEITQNIYEYLLNMEQKTEYILSVEADIDMALLFKAAGVKNEVYEEDFVQMLSRYIKIMCDVLKIQFVVFVNIRSYLTDEQLQEIIKEVAYLEVKLLLMENQERSLLKDTKRYIIDGDQCEIY